MSGHRIGVWAPAAERVEAVLGGERAEMRPNDDGWWHLERDLPPETDDAFSLDGGEPLPDPRSAWQPHGIHGPSRVVDHAAFAWTDAGWRAPPLGSGVIYELHLGTFTPGGRRHGREPVGLDGDRFIGFGQNHDQVGNRALGERISHLVSRPRAKIAAAVVLTAPFVPLLFQGEEWAASTSFQYCTHHGDPQLAHAIRDGRRAEFAGFGWKSEESSTHRRTRPSCGWGCAGRSVSGRTMPTCSSGTARWSLCGRRRRTSSTRGSRALRAASTAIRAGS